MTVTLNVDKGAWLKSVPDDAHIISGYGDGSTVLTNDQTTSPTISYAGFCVATIGSGWATWSGGYSGQVVLSGFGVTSMTLQLQGAVAFGFEVEPDLFQTESFTITLSNGKSVTENIGGEGGAQFFGYVGTGITSVTINDNAGDDFAVGDFYVQKSLGIDYRLGAAVTKDPLAAGAATVAGQFNFVGEYLGSGQSYLTKAKANQLIGAGLQIFSLYEIGAMATSAYYLSSDVLGRGKKMGEAAYADAVKVGQTSGAAIYFAIDNVDPAAGSDLLSGIEAFFEGVNEGYQIEANILGGGTAKKPTPVEYTVGVYGSGLIDSTIKSEGLATYSDLSESTGLTGSSTYSDWNIKQVLDPSKQMGQSLLQPLDLKSLTYDSMDLTNGSDFGQWGSGASLTQYMASATSSISSGAVSPTSSDLKHFSNHSPVQLFIEGRHPSALA